MKGCDDITCENGGVCKNYIEEIDTKNGGIKDRNILHCQCRKHQYAGVTCSG